MIRSLLLFVFVLLLSVTLIGGRAPADDWPQFRGPDGQGHASATDVPLTWSESENIRWKTPLPGRGWSSPVVKDDQIWLTAAVDDGRSVRALCVERGSGKLIHDVEVFRVDVPGSIHANNSYASPTPVLDGDRVYVHFGAHGTACLARDGTVLWKTKELFYQHGHGPAASPVVWHDLLLIACDGTDVQFVAALDKQTGSIRWKQPRRHISAERLNGELQVPMAYCTPLVISVDGQDQLISLGSDAVVAYEPANGNELWWFRFSGYSNVSRPVFGDGRLYFSTGFGEPTLHAIRIGGSGDVTESNEAWSTARSGVVPLDVSPLLVGDELYTISDTGIAVCYDAASGKVHWRQRLTGKFWASPVLADGRIYCLDAEATTTVLLPGKKFARLAVNELDGAAQASPAFVDGAIFLRTESHLYRIGDAASAAGD